MRGAEGTKKLADLKADLVSGDVVTFIGAWQQVYLAAERFRQLYADVGGQRSLDILRVAMVIELGAKHFLTFDENQEKLAGAEELSVLV